MYCLNLVVLTSSSFVTCYFVLFKLVSFHLVSYGSIVLDCNCIKLDIIVCLCALTRGGVISLWIMKLWSCAFVVKVWAWHSWLQLGWLHVLHCISGSFNMMNTVLVGDFRAPMAPGRSPAQIRGFGPPSGTHHSRKENRSSFVIFGLRRPPAQIPGFGPPSETHHSRTENRSSFVIFGLRRPPAQIRGFGPPSGTHHSRTENRSSLVIFGLRRPPAQIRGFGPPSGTVISGLHLPPVGRSLFL